MTPDAPAACRQQANRLQRLICTLLNVAVRAQYRVVVEGLPHFRNAPATLVVANHRRDSDVPIIAAALSGYHGQVCQPTLPYFVAREDLFRPGFLGHYLNTWPAALRALLAAIPLEKMMYALQAYPMRRIQERSLREVLEDVLAAQGNLPLADVLRPVWAERFARLAPEGAGPLTLKDALTPHYGHLLGADYGLLKLNGPIYQQIRLAERTVIAGHLDWFVQLLEQGRIVQIEPEGRLSRDGGLGRLRGGLHHLLNAPKVAVCVLPVAITYDSMTCARPHAFVRFGAENRALRGLVRKETDARVAALLGKLMTLTASQLGSHFLHRLGGETGLRIEVFDLAGVLRAQAQHFAAAGAHVDLRLLDRGGCQERTHDFLDYCRRIGLLLPDGPAQYRLQPSAQPASVHSNQACGLLDYMDNEFMVLADAWKVPVD